ncbi:MAG: hypothetical protein NVV66_07255 [Cellulomonas sp.]|uniref:hypothetical protein n=1 Tax=Cellulomonas sp. TaxID=40001 RepID=UPI00258BF8E5|nr:hypothetical protein [Cellulomonas sp.]MCR6704490.1 hypothetical protein [Cellulomonas sp.]
MIEALDARASLIDERATLLVERARAAGAAWLGELGPGPVEAAERSKWDARARTVAAYRDRYGVTSAEHALGTDVVTDRQQADARALAAEVLAVQRDNRRLVTPPEPRRATTPAPSLERQRAVGW